MSRRAQDLQESMDSSSVLVTVLLKFGIRQSGSLDFVLDFKGCVVYSGSFDTEAHRF